MILLLILSKILEGQCDLELLEADLIQGTVTVAFNNTNGCGGEAGPDGISEIQFGFQAVDADCNAMNQGWSFPFGFSLNGDNNHPGWIYSPTTMDTPTNWTNLYDESVEPPYYTGDTVVFPIFNAYQSDCVDGPFANGMYCQLEAVIGYWLDQGLSIQVVIWQISYGPTMYAEDGGWAEVGANGDGTNVGSGLYEDQNFLDNWLVVGDCGEPLPEVIIDTIYVELPGDTIYVLETDTIYVDLPADTVTVIDFDTIYVELPPDTVVTTEYDTIVEYVYDTTYVDLPPDTFVQIIFVPFPDCDWDTIYVYNTDTVNILTYDTVYQQLPPDTVEYYFTDTVYITDYVFDTTEVYIVDTVQEYVVQEIWLDCNTGDPCEDQPGMDECDEMVVFVPNAFTPNNDGINDSFHAKQSDPTCWMAWEMSIYNRWGDLIFYSEDPEEKWVGNVKGGGHYAPDGLYAWEVKARSYGGRSLSIQGSVQIVR